MQALFKSKNIHLSILSPSSFVSFGQFFINPIHGVAISNLSELESDIKADADLSQEEQEALLRCLSQVRNKFLELEQKTRSPWTVIKNARSLKGTADIFISYLIELSESLAAMDSAPLIEAYLEDVSDTSKKRFEMVPNERILIKPWFKKALERSLEALEIVKPALKKISFVPKASRKKWNL